MTPIKVGNSIIFPDTGLEWMLKDDGTVGGYTPASKELFRLLKGDDAKEFWRLLSLQVDAITEVSSMAVLTAIATNYIEHLQQENKDLASYITQMQVQPKGKVM